MKKYIFNMPPNVEHHNRRDNGNVPPPRRNFRHTFPRRMRGISLFTLFGGINHNMPRNSDNNSPHGTYSDIPMWLIVLMLVLAPPIGVILIILRVVWSLCDNSSLKKHHSASKKKPNTKNSNNSATSLKLVFGMLSAFFLTGSVVSLISVLTSEEAVSLRSFSTFVVLFMLFASVFGVSKAKKRREERCAGYCTIIGDRQYFSLSALAASAGVSYRRVRKDLQYMINHGMLGDGAYIDVGRKMFFKNTAVADEYEKSAKAVQVDDEKQAQDRVPHDEYRKIILEIRRLNDEIADIAVSDRIYRLEETTANIFDYVKEHPEKKSSIRMLMNYYLPTTLKLLTSYANIERVGVAGENMKKSKESIEQTLDMLVFAFNRELDRLYESETIDITSDIEVLEQMLKKDGIADSSVMSPTATASEAVETKEKI